MKTKVYRKKITMLVIAFTFIPALVFINMFYKNTYNIRMADHLNENRNFLESNLFFVSNEIIELNNKIRFLGNELKLNSDTQARKNLLDDFVSRIPQISDAHLVPVARVISNGTIFYDIGLENELNIYYKYKELTGLQSVLVIETTMDSQVEWFSNNATNFEFVVTSQEEVLYHSKGLYTHNQLPLSAVGENISLVRLGDNQQKYYSLKKHFPQENMTVFVFKKDNTSKVFKSFYTDYVIKVISLLLISMIVTYLISLKINYPFEKIKKAAKKIIDGNYETKVENVEDELLSLNLSFNKMATLHQEKNEEFVQYAMTMLEKNEHLTELNQQLELSYDQLKAITEMLEYSKDKYQALFDYIKEFIWVIDLDGQFTYANSVMHEKLNYEANELIGKSFFDVFLRFDEDELFNVEDMIEQLLRRDYSNLSLWFKTRDDQEVLVSANSKRTFKNGLINGAQGTARTVEFEEMLQSRVLRKNREFEIVKEITWSLANNNTMDSLLANVTQKVDELFVPEICTVRIVEGDQLVYKAGAGSLASHARVDEYSIHEDFSGVAVKENRVVRVTDFQNTQFYKKESLEVILNEIKEVIVIPLENKGKIHGTINIGLSESLSDAEVKLLMNLATQASIGIEKVKLYSQLKEEYLKTIRVLASAVEAKDKYTEGHSVRVSQFAKRIGEQLNFEVEEIEELEIAGMLHDIGKIGIDDDILTKRGALTIEEYSVMKSHPAVGKKILDPIGLSESIIDGVYLHHKRYDLKGYPEELVLTELPLYSSVIGVADAFDAMTSKRTYSDEKNINEALKEIKRFSGSQFCPTTVEALEYIIETDKESILKIIQS